MLQKYVIIWKLTSNAAPLHYKDAKAMCDLRVKVFAKITNYHNDDIEQIPGIAI